MAGQQVQKLFRTQLIFAKLPINMRKDEIANWQPTFCLPPCWPRRLAPAWDGRHWILVNLTINDGITGWGECYASAVGPRAMKMRTRDVFGRHREGESVEEIESTFR